MSTSLPDLGVHNNGRVDKVHIIPAINEKLQPLINNIALELCPQRPIIPGTGQTTINLTALVNKPPALTQANNIFQRNFAHLSYRLYPNVRTKHSFNKGPAGDSQLPCPFYPLQDL